MSDERRANPERVARRPEPWPNFVRKSSHDRPRLREHLFSQPAEPAARLAELESRLSALEERVDATPAEQADSQAHLLFVSASSGYRLVERGGVSPAVGDEVEEGGAIYVVSKVARAPLPGDRRPCAYLLPT